MRLIYILAQAPCLISDQYSFPTGSQSAEHVDCGVTWSAFTCALCPSCCDVADLWNYLNPQFPHLWHKNANSADHMRAYEELITNLQSASVLYVGQNLGNVMGSSVVQQLDPSS